MVVSTNTESSLSGFNDLLANTVRQLNEKAKVSPANIQRLTGSKLEPYVKDLMDELATGSEFEGSIELISGQRFPDIIAKRFYGIEVKTTTNDHWKTTGNSVLESTRVKEIERIFMLFGKLGTPIEFRSRPYEECLSEVVVTHSPRYQIDMELPVGCTIFDKMKISYDELRIKDNPIKPIVNYYKSKLRPGEDMWWMDNSSTSIVIRIWNSLPRDEQLAIKLKAMIFFPEIFGNSTYKYDNIPAWLVKTEGVVCKNIRDLFTAGGQVSIITATKTYTDMPKIFGNLYNNITEIEQLIEETSASLLGEYWGIKTNEKNKFNHWVDLITKNLATVINRKIDTKKILFDRIAKK